MMQKLIKMLSDLELSPRPIALNKSSTPEEKFGVPQNDVLEDVLLLLISLSSELSITL
jgi:hypothetical protein